MQCVKEKGLQFCYECANYDNQHCEKFEKLAERYHPFGVDLRANLARIQAGDVDDWLQESDQKFRCSECGKPIPVRLLKKNCYHCGMKAS
jgi:hypothetical protein